jgi:hypothetical protein
MEANNLLVNQYNWVLLDTVLKKVKKVASTVDLLQKLLSDCNQNMMKSLYKMYKS